MNDLDVVVYVILWIDLVTQMLKYAQTILVKQWCKPVIVQFQMTHTVYVSGIACVSTRVAHSVDTLCVILHVIQ